MNIWKVLVQLPMAINKLKDLAVRLEAMHDDPEFQALIASNPNLKEQSDAISLDARQIQDAFK